jgi:hypothetical protein
MFPSNKIYLAEVGVLEVPVKVIKTKNIRMDTERKVRDYPKDDVERAKRIAAHTHRIRSNLRRLEKTKGGILIPK